ncbi:D-aminoacyl-tRNA deacylase [Dietzia sp.]|uniref:D-aminoacyl-tRNA deacylase n=1 Tax=Dietzia sp. TaxID=1871616 RepID=UPI002FD94F7A
MRAVVSRCASARVLVSGQTVGRLPEPGLLALIGISVDDDERAASEMARKIAGLRILESTGEGPTNEVSASDIGAPVLLVSQFTLYGDTAKGRRPSWNRAAKGDQARPLFDALVAELTSRSLHVETGEFGANMAVESVNDGPFTVLVET